MRDLAGMWQFWAGLSALFAALTAILGKLGVNQLPPDFATLLRSCVIVLVLAAMVTATGQWRPLSEVPPRAALFLVLSALATGGSWLAYFRALKLGDAARVAPIDKLSVVLVAVIGAAFLGEKLSGLNWVGVALIAVGAIFVAL